MNSKQHLIKQQCRTCYESTQNLQFLTSYPEEDSCPSQQQQTPKTYAQLLTEVCNINPIEEDLPADQWPQFICLLCSEKLKSAYDFIQQTHKVNKLLKSFVKDSKIENHTDLFEKPELDISFDIKQEQVIENNERLFLHSPMEGIKSEIIVPTDGDENSSSNYNTQEYKYEIIEHDDESNEHYNHIIHSNYNSYADDISQSNTSDTPCYRNEKTLACNECHKLFPNANKLHRHKRFTHVAEENKHSCPLCGLKFSRSDHFKRHVRTVHDPNKPKKLVNNERKTNEIAILPLTCPECNKIFENSIKLSRHKRLVHVTEEKKFTCHLCGQKFGRSDHFRRHMRNIHNTEPIAPPKREIKLKNGRFACDKCDRSYTRRCRLYKHEREMNH